MNIYKFKRLFYRFLGRDTYPSVEELRRLGMKIGNNVDIIKSFIDPLFPEMLEIGDNVTITNSTLLVHDASTRKSLGYSKFAPIHIGNNVFVGYGSIILPGVDIGDNVIIGAGSVVTKNINSNCVVAGSPPHIIMPYTDYMEKIHNSMNKNNVYDSLPIQLNNRMFILDKYNGKLLKKYQFFK